MFWFCFVLMWIEGPRLTSRSESGVFSSVVSEGGRGVQVFVVCFSASALWEPLSAFPLNRQLRSHLLIAKEAAALCCTCCWHPSVSSSLRCSGSVQLSCEPFSIINLHSNNSREAPVRRLAPSPHNQEVPSLIPALVFLLFPCLVASAAGRLETPHSLCLCLLQSEYQNSYFTSKVRTFWLVIATSKGLLRVGIMDLVFSCLFLLSFTDELLIWLNDFLNEWLARSYLVEPLKKEVGRRVKVDKQTSELHSWLRISAALPLVCWWIFLLDAVFCAHFWVHLTVFVTVCCLSGKLRWE